jgi:hypothetical protein
VAITSGSEPSDAWLQIKRTAKQFAIQVPGFNSRLSAGDVKIEDIVDIYRQVLNSKNQLDTNAAITGLDAYVSTLPGKSAYVATSEVAAVTTLMQDALDWMDINAAGLSLTGDTMANAIANGSVATNRFSAGATSALRSILASIGALVS